MVAGELGSPWLRAQAEQLTGAIRLAQGDYAGALVSLRRALTAWRELDAPYDAARTRLLIAEASDAVDDHDGAAMERRTADASFRQLGAVRGVRLNRAPPRPGGLSEREVEVLALVARGYTNRSIAKELFISEKTVTSHLTHIFTKLGCVVASSGDGLRLRARTGGTSAEIETRRPITPSDSVSLSVAAQAMNR